VLPEFLAPPNDEVMRVLNVGDQAPDFELRRTFEEHVGLSELSARGPVLVHFYVFDFGGV
jgi:peroxiredoxin